MNAKSKKDHLDYQRKLKVNSKNQEFTYYRSSKNSKISPTLKHYNRKLIQFQNEGNQKDKHINRDHQQIANLKHQLSNFKLKYTNQQSNLINCKAHDFNSINLQGSKQLKITSDSKIINNDILIDSNYSYNQKLQNLTTNLRYIAQNSHLTLKKQKKQDLNSLTQRITLSKTNKRKSSNAQSNNIIVQQHGRYQYKNESSRNYIKSCNYSQQLKKTCIGENANGLLSQALHSQSFSMQRQKHAQQKKYQLKQDDEQKGYLANKSLIQQSYRPRGKTMASMQIPQYYQPYKVNIHNYIQKSNSRSIQDLKCSLVVKNQVACSDYNEIVKKPILFHDKNKLIKIMDLKQTQKGKQQIKKIKFGLSIQIVSQKNQQFRIINVHRSAVNSIILNSSNNNILTASDDYSVRQTNLQNQNQMSTNQIRMHRGKVNVIRTIQDQLWSGGNDCYLRTNDLSWKMNSPVLQIFPEEKDYLNIGTSSDIQRYNIQKRKAVQKMEINTSYYQLLQKTNKQLYLGQNHCLMTIDWRISLPYRKNIIKNQSTFVDQWLSNPFNYEFSKFKQQKLTFFNEKSNSEYQTAGTFSLLSHCWKQNGLFVITQNGGLLYQRNTNFLQKSLFCSIDLNICKMQVQNKKCIMGTTQGSLIIKQI